MEGLKNFKTVSLKDKKKKERGKKIDVRGGTLKIREEQ